MADNGTHIPPPIANTTLGLFFAISRTIFTNAIRQGIGRRIENEITEKGMPWAVNMRAAGTLRGTTKKAGWLHPSIIAMAGYKCPPVAPDATKIIAPSPFD
jgi:hypothetical protein